MPHTVTAFKFSLDRFYDSDIIMSIRINNVTASISNYILKQGSH